ncbi:MAG: hypothetical protein COB49_02155 [Alphaproteobacteria bacterium]|nr:MAG: hypothetical protein COB49_02155 [Alphaproteobacteria bacterium]
MSRKLIFSILGLISLVLAYVFYPSLPEWVELVISQKLPREFARLLHNSDLVAFAGFISLFGLSFFLLYLIFPVSYVWYHIHAAERIIEELPLATNETRRTDKKSFLSQLKTLGFIGRLATSYSPYLIQGPEEEVKAESLKNTRIIKKALSSGKSQKLTIAPVRATAPAEVIFNVDSLVTDHLLLGFFTAFSRVMVGAGVVCLGISMVSFSLVQGKEDVTQFSVVQTGLVAFLYLLIAAVIMAGLGHLIGLLLSQNARVLTRMINNLFHQNMWQQDMGTIQEHLAGNAMSQKFGSILNHSLAKPMKEISQAVKALTVEQEKKLDNILSETLSGFTDNMASKSQTDMANLSKILKDAAHAADQMKKQFTDINMLFGKQMDKQTIAISKHLADMQKVLNNNEKMTQKGSEKIISMLAAEVEGTYGRLGKFMENSLNKLEEKHKTLDKAVNDKNSILKDLHSSAKDLGTISNASGMLLERFISLSTELDIMLKNLQQNRADSGSGNGDKLKLAMLKLQKLNKDRIGKLPDM